ncbi:unnamed protein product [Polarella glacialis]|uniref:Uncharacterized protein n=1 Tax=Polarella glacialis TaxID=89957 RepID=A0A813H5M6_POLGL|nr:unnamed protein product [Polarella glacialis]
MAVRPAVASILLGLVACAVLSAAQSNGSSLLGGTMHQTVETSNMRLPEVQMNATSNVSLPDSSLKQVESQLAPGALSSPPEEANLNVGGWWCRW